MKMEDIDGNASFFQVILIFVDYRSNNLFPQATPDPMLCSVQKYPDTSNVAL